MESIACNDTVTLESPEDLKPLKVLSLVLDTDEFKIVTARKEEIGSIECGFPVESERQYRKIVQVLEGRIVRERREAVSYAYGICYIVAPYHYSYSVQDPGIGGIEYPVLSADGKASKLGLTFGKTKSVS